MLLEPFTLQAIEDLVASIFGTQPHPTISRVTAGVSTYVYRIQQSADVYYLRVLPELGAGFAPEALAHRLLRASSVHVPEVTYWENLNPAIGHSVMLTSAIPGSALGRHADVQQIKAVLRAAGRDLARINAVPVAGFGWIMRGTATASSLQAEFPTYREFIRDPADAHLEVLARYGILDHNAQGELQEILARLDYLFDTDQASLAHGDFDATHIFSHAGEYSGIIDFGEIRGTDRWYDLGHFQVEDGDRFPYLLEGYAEVVTLPADYRQRIWLASLLIACRRLARKVTKQPGRAVGGDPDLVALRKAALVLNDVGSC